MFPTLFAWHDSLSSENFSVGLLAIVADTEKSPCLALCHTDAHAILNHFVDTKRKHRIIRTVSRDDGMSIKKKKSGIFFSDLYFDHLPCALDWLTRKDVHWINYHRRWNGHRKPERTHSEQPNRLEPFTRAALMWSSVVAARCRCQAVCDSLIYSCECLLMKSIMVCVCDSWWHARHQCALRS